jgi:hypothetical protein
MTVVTVCTACCNNKSVFCPPTECMYVMYMILRTMGDYFPEEQELSVCGGTLCLVPSVGSGLIF